MTVHRPGPRRSGRQPRRALAAVLFGVLVLGLLPGTSRAHQVSGTEFEAPVPLSLLLAGAGATVALTALWLAAADPERVPRTAERRLLAVPASVRQGLRAVAAVLFAAFVIGAVVVGLVGRQAPNENVATTFTWAVWIHGLALVAIGAGTPWRLLSPWRLVYRGLAAIEGRRLALLGVPPAGLAAWPALAAFLALVGVLENLSVVPRSPRLTAAVVAGYGLWAVAGAVLFGPTWFERADPLELLYGLFGRVSPVVVGARGADGALSVRLPWQGTLRPVPDVSAAAFVVAMVYTVSFDGFAETRAFQSVVFAVRGALDAGPGTSVLLYLVGFAAFVAVFALACWGAERLGAGASGTDVSSWRAAGRRFAPTVVPIAAAYEVAHNYPFVFRGAGRLLALAARPLAPGVEPFDPLWWLSVPGFWGSQVALVVGGHLVAVVAAHHVAVDRYGPRARRGHLPLVAVMVGYTVLSLWIVSRPLIA